MTQSTNPFNERKQKFIDEFKTLEDVSIANKKARARSRKKKNYNKFRSLIDARNEKQQNENETHR